MNVVREKDDERELTIEEMTVEDLKTLAKQQDAYIRQLTDTIGKMNMQNLVARINILLDIMNMSDKFEQSFIDNVRAEIVELMTIKKDEV